MKKIISLVLAVTLAISSVLCVSAANEEIKVYLEGSKISFDVQPQIINGRTMVPIRAIFETMGATVTWDDATKTAISTKDGTTVKMTLNSTTEYINNTALEMDVTPVIIDGRTLAPARYVAEAFGYYAGWDAPTKSVLISKTQNPDISQIKDGTRKNPYKFGDKIRINVFKINATEPKSTFDITLKGILSPEEMENKINNSDYYTYDEDKYYLNCDVSLIYYESDSAYTFSVDSILMEQDIVTSNGDTKSSGLHWYRDPSKNTFFKLFEGDSGECYIPIDISELKDDETIDYFTITTYAGNEKDITDKKTVWFSLKAVPESEISNIDISQTRDGTRKNPYKFGDAVTMTVYKYNDDWTEKVVAETVKLTLNSFVSFEQIKAESKSDKTFYMYDDNDWFIVGDVLLAEYNQDDAYSFSDLEYGSKAVTNQLSTTSTYTWLADPVNYKNLSMYEGGSGKVYIRVDTEELEEGQTFEYFTITYSSGSSYKDETTVWFSLK